MRLRFIPLAATLAIAIASAGAIAALASSHREAPGIAKDPTADNTDLYAFVSPDKPNTVTFVNSILCLARGNISWC